MGKGYKIVVFLWLFWLCGVVFADSGVAVGLQKAWNAGQDGYLMTAGYMLRSEKRDFEYYEGGIVVLPGNRTAVTVNDPGIYSKQHRNSAYGFYGGYFYYLAPIFRPGILIGTTVTDNVTYGSADGDRYYLYSYSDFRMDYYVAFSVQMGMFSVIVSNYGVGGGLNYMF